MAALFATAIRAQEHAGGIQRLAPYQPHLRRPHPYIGPRLSGGNELFEPSRIGYGIVIQGRHVARLQTGASLIDGGSETAVGTVLDKAQIPAGA